MFNSCQSLALDMAKAGHSMLIQGSAGTGKSFVVNEIVKQLTSEGNRVQLTCSTGIACAVYPNGKASTLHRFTGIEDNRHSPNDIHNLFSSNRKYDEVIARIKTTDVLIIDEISMVSQRTFLSVNEICKFKNPNKLFGGLQLILCGDFLQLPPVANELYEDDGSFCFEATIFEKSVPHRVVLHEIIRQREANLIKAISDISVGSVSDESEQFIKTLNRPLPESTENSMTLFANNDLVNSFNRKSILEFPGDDVFEFVSEDAGDEKYLKQLTAPKTLWLKILMPVVLIRNLSNNLYNGLQGVVYEIDKDGIVIDFPTAKTMKNIPKMRFEVFSPTLNRNVASRLQYPIKPAFCLTIHKAQGMTLDRVHIDCQQIFRPGQLGVALSRATTSDGLQVINFHRKYAIAQPAKVMDFLEKDSVPLHKDRLCCKQNISVQPHDSIVEVSGLCCTDHDVELEDDIDLPEFDEEFNGVIQSIIEGEAESFAFQIPENFNIENVLSGMKFQNPSSREQNVINDLLSIMDKDKYLVFLKKQFMALSAMIDDLKIEPGKSIPAKTQTQFITKLHKHMTNAEYALDSLFLFENQSTNIPFSKEHKHICYQTVKAVRINLLKKKVDLYKYHQKPIIKREVTNASRARVRYVGGYCVAKLKQKYSKMKKTHMYALSKEGQSQYAVAQCTVNILECLREEEQEIKSTTEEPDSFTDIDRRQNRNRGLTNISDKLFNFFLHLCQLCISSLTNDKIQKHGENMFNVCLLDIQSNKKLHADFLDIVCQQVKVKNSQSFDCEEVLIDTDLLASTMECVYKEVTYKYMMVMFAQFRKDLKTSYKVEKTMAHRKQIKVSKSKAEPSKSSKKRKSVSEEESVSFPKTSVCKKRKTDPSSPTLLVATEASLSTPKQTETDICTKCKLADDNDEWITCDTCQGWFHRTCAGLKNANWWKKYSIMDVKWVCKLCKSK